MSIKKIITDNIMNNINTGEFSIMISIKVCYKDGDVISYDNINKKQLEKIISIINT